MLWTVKECPAVDEVAQYGISWCLMVFVGVVHQWAHLKHIGTFSSSLISPSYKQLKINIFHLSLDCQQKCQQSARTPTGYGAWVVLLPGSGCHSSQCSLSWRPRTLACATSTAPGWSRGRRSHLLAHRVKTSHSCFSVSE